MTANCMDIYMRVWIAMIFLDECLLSYGWYFVINIVFSLSSDTMNKFSAGRSTNLVRWLFILLLARETNEKKTSSIIFVNNFIPSRDKINRFLSHTKSKK